MAYWDVLRMLYPQEIIDVCTRAARGEIGNPRFLPSAGELYQAARPATKNLARKSPDWRPHQGRFLSSSGTLYLTENGNDTAYSADELGDFGYALPSPPEVLNRPELEARGIASVHRRLEFEPASENKAIAKMISAVVKKAAVGK